MRTTYKRRHKNLNKKNKLTLKYFTNSAIKFHQFQTKKPTKQNKHIQTKHR